MPAPMNTAQARVIDPILTNHARGYSNAEMIGHMILPVVPVPVRGIRVIKFGKEAFRRYNTRRAPGSAVGRIQYGYASDAVALHQDALEAIVPWEHQQDASVVPGIDLAQGSVEMVLDAIALGREVEVATKVRNAATYAASNKVALSGTDLWTDPASKPAEVINEAREQIRRRTGRYPNTLTLGAPVFNALSGHAGIKEQFKYTSSASITTDMLAAYFGIDRVLVGKAVVLPEGADDDTDAEDVWGNDAVLTYTPTGRDYRVPAYGYIYRLNGHPLVETPYRENAIKSWVYPVTEDWSPEVTGADAGYLIQNAA